MLREYLRRLAVLTGGLAVSAVGITMMLQANVGLEPWSVLQQGMSKTFGITYGTAAMIDGLLDKIEDELGETPTFVATGGLSKEIIAHCRKNIIYNENLLLEGLKAIYEKNNQPI